MLRLLPIAGLAFVLGAGPAAADILIGVAGPMSGPNAIFGEQLRRGAQAAIDDYNANGGLKGEHLALQLGDDGCDPKKAVEAATSLVSAGVKFVAGHFCSGASIPAAKVYEAASVLEISPSSGNPKFTDEGGWNVARVCARDDAQGAVAARFLAVNFKDRKIALLGDKTPASAAISTAFRQALAAAGASLAIDEAYAPGTKDFTELASRLATANIDAVYFSGNYPEAAYIMRSIRNQGSQAQFVGDDSLVTEEFWAIAREAAEGTLMTFAIDPQGLDSATDVVARFSNAGSPPDGATLYSYAAVETYVQAAEATSGTDSRRIADWLRAGNHVKTVLGEISFDAKGDVKEPRIAWLRWKQGRYVPAPAQNN